MTCEADNGEVSPKSKILAEAHHFQKYEVRTKNDSANWILDAYLNNFIKVSVKYPYPIPKYISSDISWINP